MCNLYSSFLVYRQFYARTNLVCIRTAIISGAALACRRAGSKRIKIYLCLCETYYDKTFVFRQQVLLRQRTFVSTSYILCCFCNGSGRAYDDNEYFDPSDLYNDNMYEYQQVQSVYDSDGHEEEIVLSDNTSECDSSESCPASGCGETSSEASVAAMDTLSNDAVDGFEVVAARHVSSDMVILENSTDELLRSAGESTVNDDEPEYQSDNFSETGRIDMNKKDS